MIGLLDARGRTIGELLILRARRRRDGSVQDDQDGRLFDLPDPVEPRPREMRDTRFKPGVRRPCGPHCMHATSPASRCQCVCGGACHGSQLTIDHMLETTA